MWLWCKLGIWSESNSDDFEKVIDVASGTFGVRTELTNTDYSIPANLEYVVRFRERDMGSED